MWTSRFFILSADISSLTDCPPIYIALAQLTETCPEDVVLQVALLGVGVNDGLGGVSGKGEDLSIVGKVGYFEVECHA